MLIFSVPQNDCNLFTYTVQRGEARTTLDRDGFWHIGEVVNKFIPGAESLGPSHPPNCPRTRQPALCSTGSTSSNDTAPVPGSSSSGSGSSSTTLAPQLLFFTSSGRIGVIVDVGPELSLHLTALERNLGKVVTEIAHASHAKRRAPVGTWGKSDADADAAAYGFLDGDFLERFLEYEHPSTETERVLRGSSPPERLRQTYGEIRQTLEALQALH